MNRIEVVHVQTPNFEFRDRSFNVKAKMYRTLSDFDIELEEMAQSTSLTKCFVYSIQSLTDVGMLGQRIARSGFIIRRRYV